MSWLMISHWSPYVVGIGIGVLSCLAFLISDKPIGCSTAYARTSGMIEKLFRGDKVKAKEYYKKFAPVLDWECMLVLGIIAGAFISAKLGGQFRFSWVPYLSEQVSGSSPFMRWLFALAGGIIIGFGSRWAGGCTSGHGISGTLQLALSSWIATVCFFIGGVITAKFMFSYF